VALEWFILQALPFPTVSIIPPMLHTHINLHVALTRRTTGRSLGTFRKLKVINLKTHLSFL